MNKFSIAFVHLDVTRVTVIESRPYGKDKCGIKKHLVAGWGIALDANLTGHQGMIPRNPAFTHIRSNHGNLQRLGYRSKFIAGIGKDHTASQQHDGCFGFQDHVQGPGHLFGVGWSAKYGQGRIRFGVIFEFFFLNIQG